MIRRRAAWLAVCLLPIWLIGSAAAQRPATPPAPQRAAAAGPPPGPAAGPGPRRRHHRGHQGRGQSANRDRHDPVLHAGAARRPVRSRPARSQPEDALRHRPVPGRAAQPRRRHPGRAPGREPAGQPRRLRGQPQADRRPASSGDAAASRARCSRRRWPSRTGSTSSISTPSAATTTRGSIRRSSGSIRTAWTWCSRSTTARSTLISKIIFVGNHEFSEDRLTEVINSREERWWRFLSTSDEYDPRAAELRQGAAAALLPEERLCRFRGAGREVRAGARPIRILPHLHDQRR